MAKKKIREEFDKFFKSGNELKIKEMLEMYPWLLQEQQQKIDENLEFQNLILAALGVMNDENGGKPSSIEDVILCLKTDFKYSKVDKSKVETVLNDADTLGYCTKDSEGWTLTVQGERICDNYLNSHTDILGPEIE